MIYLVWPLPNCAPDCPWVYVGDEQCDRSCFNKECQFDGGDCSSETKKHKKLHNHVEDYEEEEETNLKDDDEFEYYESLQRKELIESKKSYVQQINLNYSQENNIKNVFVSNQTNKIINKLKNVNNSIVKDETAKFNISDFIREHNEQTILDEHLKRKKKNRTLRKHKKYFRRFLNSSSNLNETHNGYEIKNERLLAPINVDSYALSLQHTNRVFNKAYDFISRKVPAHAPILIDKYIMGELQEKFEKEFRETIKNKIRSSNDIQYQFSYYYYIISERVNKSLEEIFDQFDTDRSQ